jgi:trans-2-enoyl-CoA reductase
MNLSLYKIFNPELKKLNNIQIQFQWKTKGIHEGLIYSIESFFNKYPYFNHETYKLYNNDLFIIDKIELMAHWHLNGIYEKRLCSDNHFQLLYFHYHLSLYLVDK